VFPNQVSVVTEFDLIDFLILILFMVYSQIALKIFHLDYTVTKKASERNQAAKRRQDSLSLVKVVVQSAARGRQLDYFLIHNSFI
jgi:hypothetical protein